MTLDLGQPFEIHHEQVRDGAVRMRLSGEFDLAGCEPFQAAFARVEGDGIREVAIDLTALTFIDSSAIRALINARDTADEQKIRLVLELPQDGQVRGVLELTGVDELFGAKSGD